MLSDPRCIHCHRPMLVLTLRSGGWRWKHQGGYRKKPCKTPETTTGSNEYTFNGESPKKPWRSP